MFMIDLADATSQYARQALAQAYDTLGEERIFSDERLDVIFLIS
jgi:hypothetical protein